MTETELQYAILDLAGYLRLHAHHCRPARTKDGWRTPVAGNAGFPDLVIAGPNGVLFVELKSEKGKLTPDQEAWRDVLQPNGRFYTWRPSDWTNGFIEGVMLSLA